METENVDLWVKHSEYCGCNYASDEDWCKKMRDEYAALKTSHAAMEAENARLAREREEMRVVVEAAMDDTLPRDEWIDAIFCARRTLRSARMKERGR
jgi:hypothetical protein